MMVEGVDAQDVELHFSLDMRYVGQSHELAVPFTWAAAERIVADFHAAHNGRFGYQRLEAGVEIVTVRVTAVAPVTPPQLTPRPPGPASAADALIGEKTVWFNQQPHPTSLYDREKLRPGHKFTGPAIVFQYDTTTVIPPEWETAVDAYGNLLLTIRQ
jgi:N-methylhydantoinase A